MDFPSWDVLITVAFVVGIAYGFVLRRERTLAALAAAYISLLVTMTWGQSVADFFKGNRVILDQIWIKSDTSSGTIQIITFLLLFLLLTGFSGFAATKTKVSGFGVFTQSFFTVGLLISSIISLLDDDKQAELFEASNFASLIYQYHNYWILIPVIMLIFMGIRYGDN